MARASDQVEVVLVADVKKFTESIKKLSSQLTSLTKTVESSSKKIRQKVEQESNNIAKITAKNLQKEIESIKAKTKETVAAANKETQVLRNAAAEAATLARKNYTAQNAAFQKEFLAFNANEEKKKRAARTRYATQQQLNRQAIVDLQHKNKIEELLEKHSLRVHEMSIRQRMSSGKNYFAQMTYSLRNFQRLFYTFGIYLSARGAIGLVGSLVSPAKEVEQFQLQYRILYGNIDQAKQKLSELFTFARVTPFELGEVVRAQRMLKVFGIDSKEVLTTIGDAAAAVGREYEEVAKWVGRLGTGITGRPLWRLSEMAIITRQMLEMRGLEFDRSGSYRGSVKRVLDETLAIMKERFAGFMEEAAKTFKGISSNINDSIYQIKVFAASPVFIYLKKELNSLYQTLGDMLATRSVSNYFYEFSKSLEYTTRFVVELVKGLYALRDILIFLTVGGLIYGLSSGFMWLGRSIKTAAWSINPWIAGLGLIIAASLDLIRSGLFNISIWDALIGVVEGLTIAFTGLGVVAVALQATEITIAPWMLAVTALSGAFLGLKFATEDYMSSYRKLRDYDTEALKTIKEMYEAKKKAMDQSYSFNKANQFTLGLYKLFNSEYREAIRNINALNQLLNEREEIEKEFVIVQKDGYFEVKKYSQAIEEANTAEHEGEQATIDLYEKRMKARIQLAETEQEKAKLTEEMEQVRAERELMNIYAIINQRIADQIAIDDTIAEVDKLGEIENRIAESNIKLENDLLLVRRGVHTEVMEMLDKRIKKEEKVNERERIATIKGIIDIFELFQEKEEMKKEATDKFLEYHMEFLSESIEKENKKVTDAAEDQTRIWRSTASSMVSMFQNSFVIIASSTESVTTKMKAIFQSFTNAIIGMIAEIVAKYLVLAILTRLIPGGTIAGIPLKKLIFGLQEGGKVEKGQIGFFEGKGTEIVAPEKDFITVAHELLNQKVMGEEKSATVYNDFSGAFLMVDDPIVVDKLFKLMNRGSLRYNQRLGK